MTLPPIELRPVWPRPHDTGPTPSSPSKAFNRWLLTCAASLATCVGLTSSVEARTPHTGAKHAASARPAAPVAGTLYGQRADVMQFGADLAARQGLDVDWVQRQLAQARQLPSVARLIMPAPVAQAKNWTAYRARFVESDRLRAGAAFWRANESWLARAEARYGVPAEIIVGIIGVETLYGRHMGNFRVIDALATLAFDFPVGRKDRSAFFRDELEQFLLLSHRESSDPQVLRGSFAGALGMPQFMPSSVNRFAVDFDGDGHIDLHRSSADVIGSVANYLAEFGWQRGLPTHFDVEPPANAAQRAVLLEPDIVPSFSVAEFIERGAVFGARAPTESALATPMPAAGASEPAAAAAEPGSVRPVGKLALVELHNAGDPPTYVAGTANFYAITRYNWSSYYALAVIELGEAVRRMR